LIWYFQRGIDKTPLKCYTINVVRDKKNDGWQVPDSVLHDKQTRKENKMKGEITIDHNTDTMCFKAENMDNAEHQEIVEQSLKRFLDDFTSSSKTISGNGIMRTLANNAAIKGTIANATITCKGDGVFFTHDCPTAFDLGAYLNGYRAKGYGIHGLFVSNDYAVITMLKDSKSTSFGARVIKGVCELMAA